MAKTITLASYTLTPMSLATGIVALLAMIFVAFQVSGAALIVMLALIAWHGLPMVANLLLIGRLLWKERFG